MRLWIRMLGVFGIRAVVVANRDGDCGSLGEYASGLDGARLSHREEGGYHGRQWHDWSAGEPGR